MFPLLVILLYEVVDYIDFVLFDKKVQKMDLSYELVGVGMNKYIIELYLIRFTIMWWALSFGSFPETIHLLLSEDPVILFVGTICLLILDEVPPNTSR